MNKTDNNIGLISDDPEGTVADTIHQENDRSVKLVRSCLSWLSSMLSCDSTSKQTRASSDEHVLENDPSSKHSFGLLANQPFIQQIIRNKFRNYTILTIAHRLNTIIDNDRIVIMNNGIITNYGTPQQLLLHIDENQEEEKAIYL
ncbi:unnamed protein product [Adineta ricciae]|uniref:Uncharacterized protein n=1 Tax=Adineta ricciae TaxID=249248 RepID=A0A815MQV0_ADIRI|nr:unnamed protein product [Adineta ricciae]